MFHTPLHEAVNGNIHGGRDRLGWLNDLCGYRVAPLKWCRSPLSLNLWDTAYVLGRGLSQASFAGA
jgi:hypothetical protein